MEAQTQAPKKSTNGRDNKINSLRFFLQQLQKVSPVLAAQIAERIFCTPRKHKRPEREYESLLFASPLPVVIGGKPLVAWQWGEGPAILLVHGWSGRASQLSAFVDPLVYAGFRVVAVDVTAHGDSQGTQASLTDFADAIYATAAAAGGVEGVICHSFGAAGLWVALSRGFTTQRIAMIAPVGSLRKSIGQFCSMLGLNQETQDIFRQRLTARSGLNLHQIDRELVAPQMNTPLLIIHDQNDKEVSLQSSHEMNKLWPNSLLVETQSLGHNRILWDETVVGRAVSFVARQEVSTKPYPLNDSFEALHLR
jgi:pimeloyl-ACP methyl ester carboxylesterase